MFKRIVFLGCLVLVAVVGWQSAPRFTGDEVAVALGVFGGVLAGIPTALLVLARTPRRGGKVGTR